MLHWAHHIFIFLIGLGFYNRDTGIKSISQGFL